MPVSECYINRTLQYIFLYNWYFSINAVFRKCMLYFEKCKPKAVWMWKKENEARKYTRNEMKYVTIFHQATKKHNRLLSSWVNFLALYLLYRSYKNESHQELFSGRKNRGRIHLLRFFPFLTVLSFIHEQLILQH